LPAYQLSKLARIDLINIADYTLDNWGEEQTYRYLDSLDACFRRLARTPQMGRSCSRLRSGYRRMEHGRYVILYRVDRDGVFVSRILHQGMLPSEHVIEDE
jgi:toxin ParE1/3/4